MRIVDREKQKDAREGSLEEIRNWYARRLTPLAFRGLRGMLLPAADLFCRKAVLSGGQIVPMVLTLAGMGLMAGADLWLSPLMGLWAGVGFKCLLVLATLPLIWATGVVSRKELAWAKDRVVGKLRSLMRRNPGEGDAA